jgi:mannosyl-oligosaccharide alpha-1,2-mannosidase
MKQDHLVCFIGGSFLLGITEGGRKQINWKNLDDKDHLDYLAGTGIIDSCTESYNTATYVDCSLAATGYLLIE